MSLQASMRHLASRFCQSNNVFHVEDWFGITLAGGADHRAAHFLQRTKTRRIDGPTDRIEPGEKLVIALYIFLTGGGFHEAGPEHVRVLEQPHQGIFSGAFYACPCNSSLFATVGTRTCDIAEGH